MAKFSRRWPCRRTSAIGTEWHEVATLHSPQLDGVEIYFVANKYPQPEQAVCSFRVSGKRPDLWLRIRARSSLRRLTTKPTAGSGADRLRRRGLGVRDFPRKRRPGRRAGRLGRTRREGAFRHGLGSLRSAAGRKQPPLAVEESGVNLTVNAGTGSMFKPQSPDSMR